jgi:hypothetical protein
VQHAGVVFDEAAKALFDADDFDVKVAHRRLAHAANGRIESGAIAAGGEDADALRARRRHDDAVLFWPRDFVKMFFYDPE